MLDKEVKLRENGHLNRTRSNPQIIESVILKIADDSSSVNVFKYRNIWQFILLHEKWKRETNENDGEKKSLQYLLHFILSKLKKSEKKSLI